ncbi:antA/AntB antirepressor family protein [Oscillibacter sp.]|uniref:antA/AntB antirepressor family protein n=1 Tax=Oscillibacter sp. TaxID=1945593 RepID=UPI00339A22F9
MNELIKVTYDNDRPLVSARELHDFLEVGADFPHWFARMCEYGFTEGSDYRTFLTDRSDGLPGKPRQDAMLCMDMAKEICMIQRNEKGKQARQYFLKLEKDWNSPEKVMVRALQFADKRIHELQERELANENKIRFAEVVGAAYASILKKEVPQLPTVPADLVRMKEERTEERRLSMSRESEFYRDNLEQVLRFSKGRQMLNIKETMEFTGIKSYATVGKLFPFVGGYISAATLARCMARKADA